MSEAVTQKRKRVSPFEGFLPFFWLACVWISGLVAADVLNLPIWVWAGMAGFCFSVMILAYTLPPSWGIRVVLWQWVQAEKRLPAGVLAVVFCLGGWRYAVARPVITPETAAYYNDRGQVVLVGQVVQLPDRRDKSTHMVVEVDSLRPVDLLVPLADPDAVSGLVLVQTPPGQDWAYGDRLRVTGALQTPSEAADFSYQDYLARKGILSTMRYADFALLARGQGGWLRTRIYALGDSAGQVLQSLFPSPESDLLSGILLGQDRGLSPELQTAFRKTGTTHIIAISGFNIAILAGLFASIFTRLFGRRLGALAAVGAISGYTLLVGADAAVVRAAIMGALGVLGGMFGRRQNGLNSLGISALGMCVVDPNMPWDVGFQLSVAATLGLVLYAQPLSEAFIKLARRWLSQDLSEKLAGPVGEFFLFTLAAQVMTLPVMAYHFGGISWMAFLANPLILPPQPMVMILGGLAMLFGLILPGLGRLFAALAMPFVTYTIRLVTWFGALPGGEVTLPAFSPAWLILFYGCLITLTLIPREKVFPALRKLVSPTVGILVLTAALFWVWGRIQKAPDGLVYLWFLDGEGTCLIQTPEGRSLLVGGGSRPSVLNQRLGERLPYGSYHLDRVLIGSDARDDLNALTGFLPRYSTDGVLWGVAMDASQSTESLHQMFEEAGISEYNLSLGDVLDLGQSTTLRVIWRGEAGDLLWLDWHNFSALIPTGEVSMLSFPPSLSPDVVVLPDGLPAAELDLTLLNAWSPSVVILPLSESDLPLRGEHPTVSLLAGYPLVTPQDEGEVVVITDGEALWVREK